MFSGVVFFNLQYVWIVHTIKKNKLFKIWLYLETQIILQATVLKGIENTGLKEVNYSFCIIPLKKISFIN